MLRAWHFEDACVLIHGNGARRHGKKIAVIENEFGEVNIDSSLVTDNLQVHQVSLCTGQACLLICIAACKGTSLSCGYSRFSEDPAGVRTGPDQS
jgi:hypothetical protein